MVWDILIAIGITASQLVITIYGVIVAIEKDRKKVAAVIGAVGIIGMGLTVLGVVRAGKEQEKLQYEIDQMQLGQRWDGYDDLSSRYRIGFVIFKMSNKGKLVFSKGRSCFGDFECDWDKVEYLSNSPDHFEIQLPDIRNKRLAIKMENAKFGGPKEVGLVQPIQEVGVVGGLMYATFCEVLDIDSTGLTLLIGMKSRAFNGSY